MAHRVIVNDGVVLGTIVMNKTRYVKVQDPQNSQFQMLLPYDQRMYRGMRCNFEGQVVEIGRKYMRVQPSLVSYFEEQNV